MTSSGSSLSAGALATDVHGPLLTVVMPAFNEADVLEDVVAELFAAVDSLATGRETRVVVVDDGSTDATWRVLETLASNEPRLAARRHDANYGFGAAVRTGIEAAETRYVLMAPADGQWDPAELAAFEAAARQGAFIAVGVRTGRSVYGLKRRILSTVYSLLVRALFHVDCPDLAWVHLYDLQTVDWRTPSTASPFYPVEIALWNLSRGTSPQALIQLPSVMRVRRVGRTKIATAPVMLQMLRDLASCSQRVRRYPSAHARQLG